MNQKSKSKNAATPASPPTYHSVPLKEIEIGERFRKEYGDIDQLAQDIKRLGLLEPLVISRDKRLLAGGRRIRAIEQLAWTHADCHYIDEVDDLTAREIELAENLSRKNLTWQEQARLSEEIKRIYELKLGPSRAGPKTGDPTKDGWSVRDTAKVRGVAEVTVRRDLYLATGLKLIPSLDKEDSPTNALRKMRRLEEDITRELYLRQRAVEVKKLESNVIYGDATSLVLSLDTASVDCIITDPPYGDQNLPYGQPHRTDKDFDDSPETAMALIRSIAPELRRVLKPSGHLYAFFSARLYEASIALWRSGGFDVHDVICIWHKTGGATGTVNWDHDYAPAWEPFLFASNRERRLSHKRDNVFAYAPDSGTQRFHPNQKPLPLLCELINQSTDPGDLILDPFGGAGSVAVAATQTNRRFITYELNERFVNIIRQRVIDTANKAPIPQMPVQDGAELEEEDMS